ncbi:MAG: NAD-dependent epimerase/dehydratase family protein [Devosiaceae bacterium]|nr:NAD-dependent epimerase/dehydratase family protein [Devosiaceae bacterium]
MANTVTVLGINGKLGQEVAKAFVNGGWRVIGMGRGNQARLDGVEFVEGDVTIVADTKRAVEGADVVINAINPPYDQWDKGRVEAMLAKILLALKGSGKTLIFPGNVYNYAAKQHLIEPDTKQNPHGDKGEIRKRMEQQLLAASKDGLQVLIVRMGDFFAANADGTMLDLMVMQRAKSNVLQYGGDLSLHHSWAYLPDAAKVFVKIAEARQNLSAFQSLHFSGHFVTGTQMIDAIQEVMPKRAKVVCVPWGMMKFIGLFSPVLREVVKMRYLWDEPHQLQDKELDALLGENFGTPFKEAVALSARSYLPK